MSERSPLLLLSVRALAASRARAIAAAGSRDHREADSA
jgi:hypothetical protein